MPARGSGSRPQARQWGAAAAPAASSTAAGIRAPYPAVTHGTPASAAASGPAISAASCSTTSTGRSRRMARRSRRRGSSSMPTNSSAKNAARRSSGAAPASSAMRGANATRVSDPPPAVRQAKPRSRSR